MLTVEPADAAPIDPVPWLVDGIWPRGGVGIVGGPPKSRKTWLALSLAGAVATGQHWLGKFAVHQGRVLYLAGEDGPGTLKQRLGDAAPWVDASHDAVRLDAAQGVEAVSDAVAQVGANLLVIDPLVRFHRQSESSLGAIRELLAGLRAISTEHGCAVVVVHHTRKGGYGGQGLRGSSELHAWGDVNIYPEPNGRVEVEQRAGPGARFCVGVVDNRLELVEPRPLFTAQRSASAPPQEPSVVPGILAGLLRGLLGGRGPRKPRTGGH